MTTGSIKELSSFLTAKAAADISKMGAASKEKAASSFSDVLNMTGRQESQASDGKADKLSQVAAKKAALGKNVQGGLVRTPNETDGAVNTKNTAADNLDRTDVCDEVTNTLKEVTDIIKEQFSVTDEELNEAMEVLSMTMVDLFDPMMLKELCVELSGAGSEFELLTNEMLYTEIQDVLTDVDEMVSKLKEELGVTDGELEELVKSFAESPDEQHITHAAEVITKEWSSDKNDSVGIKAASEEQIDNQDALKSDEIAVADVKTADSRESRKHQEQSESHEQNTGYSPVNAQLKDETIGQAANEIRSHYSDAQQSAEIARQIATQIKVQISQEKTQLEMELNPASLGKVALNVESRNGVITAAFTAQNEAVKAAIEGQIAILQENLDKQGVKVEAVEVTVASHKFEENLHKDNEENRKEQEAEEAAKISGRQRLHINLLDSDFEEGEELTEEEEINKDMMLRNGNSVDYTA